VSRSVAILTLNHIGDVLFTEPAIAALRAGYPDAPLVVITSPEGQAVLKNHPAIDALWVRGKSVLGWWRTVKWLRKNKPAVAVSFSPSSLGLALCAFASGAKARYGFAFRPLLPLFFSARLPMNPRRHVVDDYLALAEAAGGKAERRTPKLFVTEEERTQARKRLLELGWDNSKPLWGFHPFSSVARKEWGIENFAALVNWLRERWEFVPVIFGSSLERERAQLLAEKTGAIVAAGSLSLREFIAAVSWCDAFVGGDSGPTHIAAALGVPTLALFGPTDPNRSGPLGTQVVVLRSPTGEMGDIPFDAVCEAVANLRVEAKVRR